MNNTAPIPDQAGPTAVSPLQVSLVALPDAVISTIAGIFDVMNAISLMGIGPPNRPAPFHIQIVGEAAGPLTLASDVPITVQRGVDSIESADIVIVPSVLLWREIGVRVTSNPYPF